MSSSKAALDMRCAPTGAVANRNSMASTAVSDAPERKCRAAASRAEEAPKVVASVVECILLKTPGKRTRPSAPTSRKTGDAAASNTETASSVIL